MADHGRRGFLGFCLGAIAVAGVGTTFADAAKAETTIGATQVPEAQTGVESAMETTRGRGGRGFGGGGRRFGGGGRRFGGGGRRFGGGGGRVFFYGRRRRRRRGLGRILRILSRL